MKKDHHMKTQNQNSHWTKPEKKNWINWEAYHCMQLEGIPINRHRKAPGFCYQLLLQTRAMDHWDFRLLLHKQNPFKIKTLISSKPIETEKEIKTKPTKRMKTHTNSSSYRSKFKSTKLNHCLKLPMTNLSLSLPQSFCKVWVCNCRIRSVDLFTWTEN